jgi:hypothetical protein
MAMNSAERVNGRGYHCRKYFFGRAAVRWFSDSQFPKMKIQDGKHFFLGSPAN